MTAGRPPRPAQVQDIAQMARVHVQCWQETYRGLMPDAVLDDPGFPAARERMWAAALTDERYRHNRTAVAAGVSASTASFPTGQPRLRTVCAILA